MAKNTKNTTAATESPLLSITIAGTGILESASGKVDVATVSPAGLAYLLGYGLNKSLQDSVSGVAKDIADAKGDDWAAFVKEAQANAADVNIDSRVDVSNVILAARRAARLAKILAGDVGTSVRGPALRGVDKFAAEIAGEMLDNQAAKKKQPKPTGDNRKDLIAKLLASDKYGPDIRSKAQARFDEANVEFDLDAI